MSKRVFVIVCDDDSAEGDLRSAFTRLRHGAPASHSDAVRLLLRSVKRIQLGPSTEVVD